MNRPNPSDFPTQFAAAFSNGSIDSVLALYMPGGVLVDQRGIEHRGHEAIGKVLHPAIAAGAAMTITPKSVIEYGEIAVLCNDFEVRINNQVVIKSTSFEVLHFDNGSWKLAVDCPYT
jgi:ketosteroid isomerase-like protein